MTRLVSRLFPFILLLVGLALVIHFFAVPALNVLGLSFFVGLLTIGLASAFGPLLAALAAGAVFRAEGNLHLGDHITVTGPVTLSGTVLRPHGIRLTRLQDDDGNAVSVPNSVLFSSVVRVDTPQRKTPTT